MFFLQLFVTLSRLKNYALQTRIPNREKNLSLELEIALEPKLRHTALKNLKPTFSNAKLQNAKMVSHAPPLALLAWVGVQDSTASAFRGCDLKLRALLLDGTTCSAATQRFGLTWDQGPWAHNPCELGIVPKSTARGSLPAKRQ